MALQTMNCIDAALRPPSLGWTLQERALKSFIRNHPPCVYPLSAQIITRMVILLDEIVSLRPVETSAMFMNNLYQAYRRLYRQFSAERELDKPLRSRYHRDIVAGAG